ncbi:MAG: hypothetical protein ACFFD2_21090 [Promethearchaeota archaeon]
MKEKEKIKPVKYLNISGNLSADNKIYLRPSYLSLNPTGITNFEESPLKINLYKDDLLKLQWGANLGTRTPLKPSEIKDKFKRLVTGGLLFVKAKIPFPEETNRIEFVYKDIKIHEIEVAVEKPIFKEEVTIEKRNEETYRVFWKATHPEAIPLYFTVRTSADGGINWRRIASEITTNEMIIKKESLVGGDDCLIEIMAYDNVNTAISKKKVPDARPIQLIVKILSPKQNNETIFPPVKLESYCYLTGKKTMKGKPSFTWNINNKVIAETQNTILYEIEPGEYELELSVQWEKMEAKDSTRLIIEESNKLPKFSLMKSTK